MSSLLPSANAALAVFAMLDRAKAPLLGVLLCNRNRDLDALHGLHGLHDS